MRGELLFVGLLVLGVVSAVKLNLLHPKPEEQNQRLNDTTVFVHESVHHHGAIELAASVATVKTPVYIPFGDTQAQAPGGDLHHSYSYVLPRLQASQSSFILYPYSFTKKVPAETGNGTISKSFPTGAMVSINRDDWPTEVDQSKCVKNNNGVFASNFPVTSCPQEQTALSMWRAGGL